MNLRTLLSLPVLLVLGSLSARSTQSRKEPSVALSSHRPLVAIWSDYQGLASRGVPCLRIALWEGGRVLFAKDPKKWNHTLQQGHVSKGQVAELKKRIAQTGIFALKGTCYLVPDAPVDCLMVDFGAKRQMLYWDEGESPYYGINSDPTPPHLKFKKCWKAVNSLVLDSRPPDAKRIKGRFGEVPRSWYLKQAIQSQ